MVNSNLKFLPKAFGTLPVLLKLCRFRYKKVVQINPDEPQLQEMALKYRRQYGFPEDLSYMKKCVWFGIWFGDYLECAMGFEQNYSKEDGLWLFVVDILCREEFGARRSYSTLQRFFDNIPFKIRGVIHPANYGFKEFIERRNYDLIGYVFEKKASNGRISR